MYLNQLEKVKQYLVEVFVLYGVSGYDVNYNVEVFEYGVVILSSYLLVVEIQVGLFVYYYLDVEMNLVLVLFELGM